MLIVLQSENSVIDEIRQTMISDGAKNKEVTVLISPSGDSDGGLFGTRSDSRLSSSISGRRILSPPYRDTYTYISAHMIHAYTHRGCILELMRREYGVYASWGMGISKQFTTRGEKRVVY